MLLRSPIADNIGLLPTRQLARSITALENNDRAALAALRNAEPGSGLVAGITGPPGAGKSSLVDAVARELRLRNKTVAILAVDPSSRATGGAILGDRIRMQQHFADPGIFIRSMATRGHSGGIAVTTRNVAAWLRANGFDYVLIETVGVGQDEVEVASIADVVVVVLVPGMGDDVQAIKAGVMEIADLFVINKADYPGADRAAREIEAMLHLAPGPRPPIVQTVATESRGVADLIGTLDELPRRTATRPRGQSSIDHLSIAVPSLPAALEFYGALGFHENGKAATGMAHLIAGAVRIELRECATASEPAGLRHVALRVPSPTEKSAAFGGVLWELIPDDGAGTD